MLPTYYQVVMFSFANYFFLGMHFAFNGTNVITELL